MTMSGEIKSSEIKSVEEPVEESVEEAYKIGEGDDGDDSLPEPEDETPSSVTPSCSVDPPSKPSSASRSANWRANRRSSIKVLMNEKKKEETYPLGQNIYSLLIVAPIFSWPFLFSMSVVLGKIAILSCVLSDYDINDLQEEQPKVSVAKGLLIPVAVAMQEDMIDCFFFYANLKHSPDMLKHSEYATKKKLYMSYYIRTIDGLLSLLANFLIMLVTPDTLGVFLNFAALQFLYSIDDVFYELVVQGFFGDHMEDWAKVCEKVTLYRRQGKSNKTICGYIRIGWLDTILFCVTMLICYLIYAVNTAAKYDLAFAEEYFSSAPPSISAMPTETPSMVPTMMPTPNASLAPTIASSSSPTSATSLSPTSTLSTSPMSEIVEEILDAANATDSSSSVGTEGRLEVLAENIVEAVQEQQLN